MLHLQVIAAYNLTMFVIRSIQGHPDDSTEAIATGLTFLFYTIMLYMFCDAGHNITAKVTLSYQMLPEIPVSKPLPPPFERLNIFNILWPMY